MADLTTPAKAAPGKPAAAPAKASGAQAVAAPAPAAPAAPAKPAPAPVAPTPPPAGDFATLAAAIPGSSYAKLEDGTGVLTVPADDLFTAASWVRDAGYNVFSLLSAYDRIDHFGVIYAFVRLAGTPEEFGEMRLRVTMPKTAGEPTCPSLVDLFPGANWQEREMFDMYGIKFEGHPDMRRMFLPEDWSGYPMRKDNKEPEQFVALREGEDITLKTQEEGSW